MGACWECIKCPGKVVCCCCKCACNMLAGILCSVLVLLIIIGVIVYFTVFHNKDNGGDAKAITPLLAATPSNFRDFFSKVE